MAEEIDANREIRRVVDTGKTLFGARQGRKSILKGDAQLIIVSNNLNRPSRESISHLAEIAQIPIYEFSGSGLELGAICGKPFVVSVMVVQNIGKSRILGCVPKKADARILHAKRA